jgi:hypothetical protein
MFNENLAKMLSVALQNFTGDDNIRNYMQSLLFIVIIIRQFDLCNNFVNLKARM